MKVLLKTVFIVSLLVTVSKPPGASAQGLSKSSTKINAILDLDFPGSFSTTKNGHVTNYFGEDTLGSYELIYFDTVVVRTSSEPYFNMALKGFVAGRFAGEGFKSHDLVLTDTLVGNLPGLFITGKTDDTLQDVKRFYCFVTVANSNSYWFYYYWKKPSLPVNRADSFFSSIQFKSAKIKEAAFTINAVRKHKAIGEAWYLSPELDYPIPSEESMATNPGASSYPPPPPPPPLDKKWIIQTKKLASDYSLDRQQADKKYKINQGSIIVEGIVKEIKQADDYYATVILEGSSNINIQLEGLSYRRLKNLKKGMKAIFMGKCTGLKGNIILTGGIYIENPTYE